MFRFFIASPGPLWPPRYIIATDNKKQRVLILEGRESVACIPSVNLCFLTVTQDSICHLLTLEETAGSLALVNQGSELQQGQSTQSLESWTHTHCLVASGLLGPAAGWAPAGSAVGTPQSSGPDAQESRGGCAERRPGHSEHCTVPGTQSTIPGTQSTIPGTQSAVWGPLGPCASQLRADICTGLTEDTAAGANVPRRGACTLPGRPLEGLPGCSDRASVSGRQ